MEYLDYLVDLEIFDIDLNTSNILAILLMIEVMFVELKYMNWNKLMDDKMLMIMDILRRISMELDFSLFHILLYEDFVDKISTEFDNNFDRILDVEMDNVYVNYIDKLNQKNDYALKAMDMALNVLEQPLFVADQDDK